MGEAVTPLPPGISSAPISPDAPAVTDLRGPSRPFLAAQAHIVQARGETVRRTQGGACAVRGLCPAREGIS